MKVDISGPLDTDGPLLVELEQVLTHRIIVTVDGKTVLEADVRDLFLRGMISAKNSTRLDLGNVDVGF